MLVLHLAQKLHVGSDAYCGSLSPASFLFLVSPCAVCELPTLNAPAAVSCVSHSGHQDVKLMYI